MAKGKDGNVNEKTWKSWLAVCFGKGDSPAVGLTAPLLEGMNRVFAKSDSLKCSEALLDKMQAASVALQACYSVAHSIMEMSSVRETPQFVLNFIEGSVSKLDGGKLPADELGKSLLKALEMAKGEARESVVAIADGFLSCEGYTSSEKTSVLTGLRTCGFFDSCLLERLKAFWKKAAKKKKKEKALVVDVARAVNAICQRWEKPDTWQAYVMELDAGSVASVVKGTLECRDPGSELVEMLRSFVYLRPLERETLLRVCQHVKEVLAKDDDEEAGETSFSDCVHALVRSLVKLSGRGGGAANIFSELGDATLERIGSELARRRPGENLTEAVALLAAKGGPGAAERAIPQLRKSLVRLLSSPDGGTRKNSIEALRVLTGAATFGAMGKADAVGFKGATMCVKGMQDGHRDRVVAINEKCDLR